MMKQVKCSGDPVNIAAMFLFILTNAENQPCSYSVNVSNLKYF